MAENAEDAREQRHAHPVDLGKLVAQIAHQRLRHRQPDRGPTHLHLAHVISSLGLGVTINGYIEY